MSSGDLQDYTYAVGLGILGVPVDFTSVTQYPNCGYQFNQATSTLTEFSFDPSYTFATYQTAEIALIGDHDEIVSIDLVDPTLLSTFSFQTNVFTISVVCNLSQNSVFDSSLLDISPVVHVFGVPKTIALPTVTQVPACGFPVTGMTNTPDLAGILQLVVID